VKPMGTDVIHTGISWSAKFDAYRTDRCYTVRQSRDMVVPSATHRGRSEPGPRSKSADAREASMIPH
jgi:hypothetical protein